jgi:hypothetical protein
MFRTLGLVIAMEFVVLAALGVLAALAVTLVH